MIAAKAVKMVAAAKSPVIQSSRSMSALSGPPQVKISTLEQIMHGTALAVGILAIPTWVLVHMKQYRGVAE